MIKRLYRKFARKLYNAKIPTETKNVSVGIFVNQNPTGFFFVVSSCVNNHILFLPKVISQGPGHTGRKYHMWLPFETVAIFYVGLHLQ